MGTARSVSVAEFHALSRNFRECRVTDIHHTGCGREGPFGRSLFLSYVFRATLRAKRGGPARLTPLISNSRRRGFMAETATSADLKQLPLHALLACAARCARRVQPLFAGDGAGGQLAECAKALDRAIE